MANHDAEQIDSRVKEGSWAIAQGELTQALEILLPCANEGNARAKALAGFCLSLPGSQQNIPEAIKFLTDAAEQGVSDAAHNLGMLYSSPYPEASLPNELESMKWFERACELGSSASKAWLGR